MKKLAAFVFAVLPVAASAAPHSVTQVSPAPGSILRAGDVVRIAWNVNLQDDALTTDCEQELFLSLDGGTTNRYRLTPMMRANVREYLWTVPEINAKSAILDIRFGCAESEEMFTLTPWNPQYSFEFQIVSNRAGRLLLSAPTVDRPDVLPGETVNLTWKNGGKWVKDYQVRASFDQGAHFVTIGSTRGHSLAWQVPAQATGGVVFQVIARLANGVRVSSPMSVRPDVSIR